MDKLYGLSFFSATRCMLWHLLCSFSVLTSHMFVTSGTSVPVFWLVSLLACLCLTALSAQTVYRIPCHWQVAAETPKTFSSVFADSRDDILSRINPTDLLLTKLRERRLLSQQQVDDIKVSGRTDFSDDRPVDHSCN